jgi:threonine dehydrogenase-like Zn-dependent dehydrogenase
VILTANPWPAYRTALEIVRPNGRVSIVSLLGRGEAQLDFNPLSMQHFYIKGISLIAVSGPAGYLYPNDGAGPMDMQDRYAADRTAAHILSLMVDGRLAPKRLITHHFHYTQMAEAYEMAFQREKGMLGVIFTWQDGSA